MSKPAGIDGPQPSERRFHVVVTTDDDGIEHLTMERLVDLAEAPHEDIPHDYLVDLACRIYDTRRARARYFDGLALGEPLWDMLLALFCLPSRGERLTVSNLSLAADIPQTTGLRWTHRIERHGLIERTRDPTDGRRVYLKLTDKGERLMLDFLSAIYHQLTRGVSDE